MAKHNGHHPTAPLDFPPDVDSGTEFIKRQVDPEDEVIEVGVAIVGGGTAGLATANRLLQLRSRLPGACAAWAASITQRLARSSSRDTRQHSTQVQGATATAR